MIKKGEELKRLAQSVMGGMQLGDAMKTVESDDRDDLLEELRKKKDKEKSRFSKLFPK